ARRSRPSWAVAWIRSCSPRAIANASRMRFAMSFEPGALIAPERNRYFYGLLMDAERFQKDQDYFNGKLDLLNRFVGGCGVVCGLDLAFDAGKSALTLGPGVAIDLAGREVVVPASTP